MKKRLGKRGIIFLVVAGLVLALAGWWWAAQPKTYRLVGRYPLLNEPNAMIRPTAAGFIVQESENLYVMRDWVTGKER